MGLLDLGHDVLPDDRWFCHAPGCTGPDRYSASREPGGGFTYLRTIDPNIPQGPWAAARLILVMISSMPMGGCVLACFVPGPGRTAPGAHIRPCATGQPGMQWLWV